MSTRWESYCNTTTDLFAVEPQIDSFDRKRIIQGFTLVSGSVYTKGNAGYIARLFRNGVDLGTAQATSGAVDTDGEWHYDSATDVLTICSSSNPNTVSTYEAGQVWSTLKTEAVARASEFVRAYLAKPIIKRSGTGEMSESLRDYDDVIIMATAYLACSFLIDPYDMERGTALRMKAYSGLPDSPGILDLIKRGDIALWNEITAGYNTGVPRVVTVDATTTGGIVETVGTATVAFDKVKVIIGTGGTITEGSASSVTYSVYVASSTGLKTSQAVSAAVVDCSYQPLAHGIWVRFSPGKYTANDEWEVEVRGGQPEAGTKARTIMLTRL